ncbi:MULTISPECIES: hypothetical protein [unclassified Sphingomonas]|nr:MULTISPECIES: hypothetical protein [unclassified Sphingomonas]MBN8848178.1 hypothetical protein [Sphingomonas sp.]
MTMLLAAIVIGLLVADLLAGILIGSFIRAGAGQGATAPSEADDAAA